MYKSLLLLTFFASSACDFTPQYDLLGTWQITTENCVGSYEMNGATLIVTELPFDVADGELNASAILRLAEVPGRGDDTVLCTNSHNFVNPTQLLSNDAQLSCSDDESADSLLELEFDEDINGVFGTGILGFERGDEGAQQCDLTLVRAE